MENSERKCRLAFVGSWLMAKLLGSLELSRLAIFRFIPQAEVQTIAKREVLLTPTEWIYERPFLYTLTMDEEKSNFVFTKVSEIISN